MSLVIVLVIGMMIGVLLARFIFKEKCIGTIRVDQSDPDSAPYLFLELTNDGWRAIYKKKYVVLKVNLKDYISQE